MGFIPSLFGDVHHSKDIYKMNFRLMQKFFFFLVLFSISCNIFIYISS